MDTIRYAATDFWWQNASSENGEQGVYCSNLGCDKTGTIRVLFFSNSDAFPIERIQFSRHQFSLFEILSNSAKMMEIISELSKRDQRIRNSEKKINDPSLSTEVFHDQGVDSILKKKC